MKTKTKKTKCCCIPILEELKKKHIKFMKKKKIGKTQVCLLHSLPVIILILALLYFFKGQFVIALVNGKPIFRQTLIKELEKQAGQKALEAIITKTLILQKAKKENIQVTEEEINQEVQKIEESLTAQGQDLNQLLKQQGMTQENLKEELKIQKIVEKIATKDIQITEDEVASFIAERKDFYPPDQDPEDLNKQVRKQLMEQKTGEAVQTWIAALQKEANIAYWSQAYKAPSLEK